jgi:hypothetical protein
MIPRRLLDDSSAPAELRAVLQSAPGPKPLDRATFERGRSRLARTAAVTGTFAALFTLKGLSIAFATTAVAVGSGYALTMKREAPEKPRSVEHVAPRPAARSDVAKATPATVPLPADALSVASAAPASLRPGQTSRVPRPVAGDLEAELRALEQARAAARTEPGRSLSLLDRYQSDFPSGHLRFEASVVRVEALSRLGRLEEARALAKRIERSAEGSLYSERLKKALGTD